MSRKWVKSGQNRDRAAVCLVTMYFDKHILPITSGWTLYLEGENMVSPPSLAAFVHRVGPLVFRESARQLACQMKGAPHLHEVTFHPNGLVLKLNQFDEDMPFLATPAVAHVLSALDSVLALGDNYRCVVETDNEFLDQAPALLAD